jgi:hypothetical protein
VTLSNPEKKKVFQAFILMFGRSWKYRMNRMFQISIETNLFVSFGKFVSFRVVEGPANFLTSTELKEHAIMFENYSNGPANQESINVPTVIDVFI